MKVYLKSNAGQMSHLCLITLAQGASNIPKAEEMVRVYFQAWKSADPFQQHPIGQKLVLWPPSQMQRRTGNVVCEAAAWSPYCIVLCGQAEAQGGRVCEGKQQVWGSTRQMAAAAAS